MASHARRLLPVLLLALPVACATATPPPPAYDDSPATASSGDGAPKKGPVFYTADEPPPGASDGPPSSGGPTPVGDGPKPVGDVGGAGVRLISNGAEPRAVMKLDPKVGTKEKVTVSSSESTAMSAAGMNIPEQASKSKIEVSLKVTAVKDGVIEWSFQVLSASGPAGNGAPKIGDLKGAKGTATTKQTGEAGDCDIDGNADAGAKGLLKELLANVSPVFPSEEIGAGAKWSVTSSSDAGGIQTNIVTTYTLESATGGKGKIAIAQKHSAPEQDFNPPGLPMPGKISSYDGTGTGSLSFDAKHLAVRSRNVSANIKTGISLAGMGDAMQVSASSKGEEKTESK